MIVWDVTPVFVKTGPVFTKDGLTCPRGIITNDLTLRMTCLVMIARSPTTTRLFRQIGHNTFLMYFVQGCRVPQDLYHMAYVLSMSERPCRIAGRVWTLHGMAELLLRVDIHALMIPIAPLNWSDLVSHNVIQSKLDALPWLGHFCLKLKMFTLPHWTHRLSSLIYLIGKPPLTFVGGHFCFWSYILSPALRSFITFGTNSLQVLRREPIDPADTPNITSRN